MKPAPFRYHRARSLDEALALLAAHPEAKLVAGGQSLAPMMNMRLVQPSDLVDLAAVPDLDFVRISDNQLEIGALATHHAVATSTLVREHCPLLAHAAQTIGHYAIRKRGTLGGSLAHADPAAQLPLVAATLGAELVLAGPRGERRVPAREFFVSLMTTVLAPDEILVRARFPKAAPGERHAWQHFSRRTGDFAIVAVAAVSNEQKLCIGIGGAEDKPVVLPQFSSAEKPDLIARKARDAVDPAENPRVPATFRKELVEALVKRALAQCSNSN